MRKRKILAMIIALLTLAFIFSGCGKNENENFEDSSTFGIIEVRNIGSYVQTHVYDKETMVEYVYFWHSGSGHMVSTVLYKSDGTHKTYTGYDSKFILQSIESVGNYEVSIIYDTETLVTYSLFWHRGTGDVTIQLLYDNNMPKLYQDLNE